MARALGIVSLAVAGLILTGAPASAKGAVHIVTIGGMAFAPAPKGLKAGDTVLWVNMDLFEHTVTARNGAFDVDLKPGEKARTVLKTDGPVDFYCRFHPGMTGRLLVGR